MEVKLPFVYLILFVLFFSKISFATTEHNTLFSDHIIPNNSKQIAQINEPKTVENSEKKFSNIATFINSNNNKILINKRKINKLESIQTESAKQLHERIDLFQRKTLTINDSIYQNSTDINLNKEQIRSTQKVFSNQRDTSLKNQQKIDDISKTLNHLNSTSGLTSDYLDRFWVLISAILVFFMQAGFKTFESGMVRKVHDDNVAIKNVVDWLIISLVYFVIGFGIMFGESLNGLIGTNLFSPSFAIMQDLKNSIDGQYLGLEFFLFQLAFAATAATIVSGAMSERVALIPYIFLSIFIGTIIYPIFGHWAWGGSYLLTDQGWLYNLGFRDFAGSTVVHSIGAWVALAGIVEIGARNGRYDKHGNLNRNDFVPSNLGYSTLGVLILWFGWWGFNGGSQLKYDENVASIILNTCLAGSAAGLSAFFHAFTKSRDKNEIFPKLLGGILGGLVAITACCNSVSSFEAIFIGVVAGLIHNYSHDLLTLKLKLDDPVGAVAVHGFCGVWGTMCVALFGDLQTDFFSLNHELLFSQHSIFGFIGDDNIRTKQAIVQLIGIVSAFLFSFLLSLIFFKLIRKIPGIGLRVLPSDEKTGSLLGISN